LWISWNATHGVIQERLEREFNMTVITTVLTFRIMLLKKDPDTVLIVNNPSDLPEPSRLDHVEAVHQGYYYYKIRLCW
jgi:translation elongation factor EF-4